MNVVKNVLALAIAIAFVTALVASTIIAMGGWFFLPFVGTGLLTWAIVRLVDWSLGL